MKKHTPVLLGIMLLKIVLHYFLIGGDYELHRDEFLHLDQAYHLAWGFQTVPPLSSWISVVIHWLGGGEFWVKLFPALFGAITIWFVWKIVEHLQGDLTALLLASVSLLFSAVLRTNMLFQPNSFDILAWTALFYMIIKYIDSEESKWLYGSAVVFALGFLNKYNIVFLLMGLFPAILVSR